jgi:hypothetical protein
MGLWVKYLDGEGKVTQEIFVEEGAEDLLGGNLAVGQKKGASFDKMPGDDARLYTVVAMGPEQHPQHGEVETIRLQLAAN